MPLKSGPVTGDTDNLLFMKILLALLGTNNTTSGISALGDRADAPATGPATTAIASMIALLKAIFNVFVAFTDVIAGTLSTPAADGEADLGGRYLKNHVFTFTVANIETDVTVGIFGKANGEVSFSQSGENNSLITANGRYLVRISNTPLEKIALRLVAETGGTAVTIENIKYRGSN